MYSFSHLYVTSNVYNKNNYSLASVILAHNQNLNPTECCCIQLHYYSKRLLLGSLQKRNIFFVNANKKNLNNG